MNPRKYAQNVSKNVTHCATKQTFRYAIDKPDTTTHVVLEGPVRRD